MVTAPSFRCYAKQLLPRLPPAATNCHQLPPISYPLSPTFTQNHQKRTHKLPMQPPMCFRGSRTANITESTPPRQTHVMHASGRQETTNWEPSAANHTARSSSELTGSFFKISICPIIVALPSPFQAQCQVLPHSCHPRSLSAAFPFAASDQRLVTNPARRPMSSYLY